MEDRRKERRKKLMAFTPVYDSRKGNVLGYLGDLTMQGAMVIGEHPLEIDNLLTLAIEFPGELEGIAAERMIIPARVARCVADETPHSFMIGFQFMDVSPDRAKMIQALLDRYHFRHRGVVTD